jgi:hypothetical protein
MEAMQGRAEHLPSRATGNAPVSVAVDGKLRRPIHRRNGFKKSSPQELRQGIASRRRHVAPALSLC